jgi:hypothetical protein
VLGLFWLLLMVNESLWWWHLARGAPPLRTLRIARPAARMNTPQPTHLRDDKVTQRVVRILEGTEDVITAEFRCCFESNERAVPVHLVFCPPLRSIPTVTTQQLDGPACTWKTVQCQCYGARLEVRRQGSLESLASVFIRVTARAQAG